MNTKKWLVNPIVVCIMASICSGLWGSAFPFVKIGYKMFRISSNATGSQILFAGIRFTLAGILTLLIGIILSKKILVPKLQSLPKILCLGLLQTVLQYVFFYIGLSHTTGVKASIIEGVNVFVALLVASFIFRQEKFTRKKLLGCFIGFLGVVIVNVNTDGIQMDFKLMGEGFVILSTIAYAFSSVLFKHYSKRENAVMLCAYQFLIGGVIMIAVGICMGGRMGGYLNSVSVALLLYMAFISAVAYSIWGILLKYNPVSRVAVYGFMTPVFGVILSAFLLHENRLIGFQCFFSLILVCAGICIVNYTKNKEVI